MSPTQYIFPEHSDRGTVLAPDQVAVTYDDEAGYAIFVPDDESAEIPERAVALVAAAMRLGEDDAFYNGLLEWFEQRQNELEQGGDE